MAYLSISEKPIQEIALNLLNPMLVQLLFLWQIYFLFDCNPVLPSLFCSCVTLALCIPSSKPPIPLNSEKYLNGGRNFGLVGLILLPFDNTFPVPAPHVPPNIPRQ